MTSAIASTVATVATAPAAPPADHPSTRALHARFEELSLYAESGNATFAGEIWYVPESAPFFGDDGLSFGDLLDLINPLHHIPVVSTLYRHFSGDSIAPGPRLFGGALFGGPIGFVGALVDAAVEDATGADIGGNVLAWATGGGAANPEPLGPAVADAAAVRERPPAATAPSMSKAGAAEAVPAKEQAAAAEALIRARSAVPRASAGKIARAGIGLPPPAPAPVAAKAGGTPGRIEPEPARAPVPRAEPSASEPSPAEAPLGVPQMMVQALDKYEALLRERRGQKVAEEI